MGKEIKGEELMNKIVSLCKRRGFVYQGSEIYGGLANTWDYGPLGVELKRNVKEAWWKRVVRERDDVVGLDSAILMHPKTWEASGHLASFNDALIDCKVCKSRFRADHLIEEALEMDVEGKSEEEMTKIIKENEIKCPTCGNADWTDARAFNLMFKTFQGVVEDQSNVVYLRPETAQGIFVNFKNVVDTCRVKLPFGIAQIGKAFRNEITPGNFIFRTREFEQMELEFFVRPGEDEEWFEYWREFAMNWFIELGVSSERLKFYDHPKEKLSHYSKATTDLIFHFPFGWEELWGIANRTDFDLSAHIEHSGKKLTYYDPQTKEHIVPYVIEPSLGVDRAMLAFLVDAYSEDEVEGQTRVYLDFHPELAPIKVAVLPLTKKDSLKELAMKIYNRLKKLYNAEYDEGGSIGKRYRRQDEIGTPYCITVDFESLDDQMVTVRDRNTLEQDRIAIDQVEQYLRDKLGF
ncbi:glycine--tRNA ligase [Anoxybacter fermentans]|uniref:Glycine--tRNA ligase n=1 Tax=Anoxybacter fermentans TaxID=1323375 RepID=A0A3Q9HPG0_9FIRM|nr:glycine--tRNA ligase [Anoxybacter fermentans]AZR72452.1 glycine--tRNA ligase [Anoxybacter fermentans]